MARPNHRGMGGYNTPLVLGLSKMRIVLLLGKVEDACAIPTLVGEGVGQGHQ